mmetsp:Transcript_48/g.98  ORF Transcript_48/g.98 Transcript_48/m.98 type:complete len:368 (-) Transcript_48:422-1525(-)
MLQTERRSINHNPIRANVTGKKVFTLKDSTTFLPSEIVPMSKANNGENQKSPAKPDAKPASSAAENHFEWEEVKKARNRINSQRIRERERAQIANLEAERARLWLSNDAIRFQNRHFREVIAKIVEVREMKRSRSIVNGGIDIGGTGIATAPAAQTALAASLGATGALGGGTSMQMPLAAIRQNTNVIGGLGGGLDATGLFQNRLAASAKSFSGLSDSEILARHQATTLEMQNMVRQQEAMDRLGAGGGVGIGSFLNNGVNINSMNMNSIAASPYVDIADNFRIRQLMLQQSTANDLDSSGLLSSIGVGGSNTLGSGVGVGISCGDATIGNANGSGLSFGIGALGDLGSGMGDADLLQMSKRQKFGY